MSAPPAPPPAAAPLRMLHEDAHLIALDKPAGLLAVPGRGADKSDCLSARAQCRWPDALVHGAAEPDWQCGACRVHTPRWSLVCPDCAAVATLGWVDRAAGSAAPRRIGG